MVIVINTGYRIFPGKNYQQFLTASWLVMVGHHSTLRHLFRHWCHLAAQVIIMLSYESTSFLLTLLWVLNAAGYKKHLGAEMLPVEAFRACPQPTRGPKPVHCRVGMWRQ